MELADEARRILSHLAMAKDAYLLGGPRDSEEPFNLIDKAALAENRSHVEWLPVVDRNVVRQLAEAGYIQDSTGTPESIKVAFTISDKGRELFPVSN